MITAVVIRRSNSENTVAIVSCEASGTVKSTYDLLQALKRAIAAWGRESDQGRAVLSTCNDFNVGDAAGFYEVPGFRNYCRREGIDGLRIECYCEDCPSGWDFDDNLADNLNTVVRKRPRGAGVYPV